MMPKKGFIFLVLALCTPSAFAPGHARAEVLQMTDYNRCVQYFELYEKKFAIPRHLLKAISLTESGRWNREIKQVVPWPWTINVGGKGYYLNSKDQAIQNVRFHVSNGARSYDVGCMQVNMLYHGHAFRNLYQAFDPRYNIAYAASFLRQNYEKFHNWDKAVAAYHSQTDYRGRAYAGKVRKTWHELMRLAYYEPRPENVRKLAMNSPLESGYSVTRRKAAFD